MKQRMELLMGAHTRASATQVVLADGAACWQQA
jgi:hypothetical protein